LIDAASRKRALKRQNPLRTYTGAGLPFLTAATHANTCNKKLMRVKTILQRTLLQRTTALRLLLYTTKLIAYLIAYLIA
jgi:hypothetical protein